MPWISVIGAVGGALLSSKASGKAADQQSDAANRASGISEAQYQQTRQDNMPWRGVGLGALGGLAQGLGINAPAAGMPGAPTGETYEQVRARLTPKFRGNYGGNGIDDAGLDQAAQQEFQNIQSQQQVQQGANSTGVGFGDFNRDFTQADFQKDPGYDFRLNQGLDAVQGSRAARGSMLSGATLKALSDYGSDYASSEYGKAYDRFNNDRTQRFNRLATVAGIGQTATNNVGTAGALNSANASSNAIGSGNAQAAGTIGQANALTGGLSNLQSLYQLNQLNRKTPGGGSQSGWGTGDYYGNEDQGLYL